MNRPSSPTSFSLEGFELAKEILGSSRNSGETGAATREPISRAAPDAIDAELARLRAKWDPIKTVPTPPGHEPTAEQWADYDAGRVPSCVEELSPRLRQRELRRQGRNRDGF